MKIVATKAMRAATLVAAGCALAAQPAMVSAAGEAKLGARLFLQCRACHSVAPGAPNAVGPNLAGVVGAKSATRPGYSYSPALAKAGLTWTPATLDAWIKRPSALVPGNKMIFAGIADPATRANIIAYLATLKAK